MTKIEHYKHNEATHARGQGNLTTTPLCSEKTKQATQHLFETNPTAADFSTPSSPCPGLCFSGKSTFYCEM